MSKIQKRLSFYVLLDQLESNNLFTSCQASYRKGTMLSDFSKDFDCIPHKRLLQTLHRYHISRNVIKWLFSYLYDCHQTVTDVNGNSGPWNHLSSGVSQGSVLGTLLFTSYLPESLFFLSLTSWSTQTIPKSTIAVNHHKFNRASPTSRAMLNLSPTGPFRIG